MRHELQFLLGVAASTSAELWVPATVSVDNYLIIAGKGLEFFGSHFNGCNLEGGCPLAQICSPSKKGFWASFPNYNSRISALSMNFGAISV